MARRCCSGEMDLIEGKRPDTAFFDMSTNSVAMVRKIHAIFAEKNLYVLDSPCQRRPERRRQRQDGDLGRRRASTQWATRRPISARSAPARSAELDAPVRRDAEEIGRPRRNAYEAGIKGLAAPGHPGPRARFDVGADEEGELAWIEFQPRDVRPAQLPRYVWCLGKANMRRNLPNNHCRVRMPCVVLEVAHRVTGACSVCVARKRRQGADLPVRARPQIIESTFDRVRYGVYNQTEYRMLWG
jgi:hypothetical protein